MIDLLYSRYGAGAKDILMCEFEDGMEIIGEAHKIRQDELAFYRWAISYQEVMPFDEFKRKIGISKTSNMQTEDNQTPEEILKEVKGILDGNI